MTTFDRAVDAIINGDADTLRDLLREHPDLIRARSPREHHAMLLHYVGANGVEDELQKTPKNAVEIATILLDAGAEVDAMADMYGGSTTVELVATSIHPEVAGVQDELIELLLARGAAIGTSTINSCLANGRLKAANTLTRLGATLDVEGAAGIGRLDIVKSLIDTASEDTILSGFQWACEYGQTDVVAFLLEHGVDVAKVHRGQTGLHWAACGGHVDIVRMLLDHGAPIDVRDERYDATPLGWAEYCGHPELAALLR